MAIFDLQSLIDDLVPDTSGRITPAKVDRALASAVVRYGKDRPRVLVEDVVCAGGNDVPLPTGWVSGASRLLELETPIGQMPPVLISQEDWLVLPVPAGDGIRVRDSLAAGTGVRVRFYAPHVLSDAVDTIPALDREAVAHWAGALLADQLAAAYAANSEATIQADRVDQTSPSRTWRKQADVYRQRYFDLLGIDPKLTEPAGEVVNLDQADSRGRPRLTHWRNR
ncbi:hypothetical protein [Rhodocyclus tenuis]|uniref:Uncharacterized protein n=1 Tax=Rhodocyclus tenuis TaxID=1066 RepID=A0A840G255_RHOTE|nr:hypothetical protein [Rhodocyclus tenuis]MBB4248384.1 hypothetical protein [Rhodocyclus tenuis]